LFCVVAEIVTAEIAINYVVTKRAIGQRGIGGHEEAQEGMRMNIEKNVKGLKATGCTQEELAGLTRQLSANGIGYSYGVEDNTLEVSYRNMGIDVEIVDTRTGAMKRSVKEGE
jgi:hypothetical protein